jgi:polysaccharide biosynthesis/export protein
MKSGRCRGSILWMLLLVVWTAAAQEKPGSVPTLAPASARYQLRVGDSLEINFRFTPEFNQVTTVQPDGFINLRDMPDIYVLGKSTPEIMKILEKSYSNILHDPVITVLLKEFEKPYFIAMGELGRPGKYDLLEKITVVEGLAIAGGFRESSKHSQVLLFRKMSERWTEVKKLNVKEMLAAADLAEDLQLRPGDMIYVPKNALSKIKPYIPTPSIGAYAPTY